MGTDMWLNKPEENEALHHLSEIFLTVEFEKRNLSLESYQTIREHLNSTAKAICGMDGVTKLESTALGALKKRR